MSKVSPKICALLLTVFTLAVSILPLPHSQKVWKHTGNVSNLVFPLMAGVCAYKKADLPRYVVMQAAAMGTVKIGKSAYGKEEINRRPNGHHRGYVSGHSQFTATSVMYLTLNKCHQSKWNGVLHYITALTGYSRVGANAHFPIQAVRGIIVGYLSVLIFSRRRTKMLALFVRDLVSDVVKLSNKGYSKIKNILG